MGWDIPKGLPGPQTGPPTTNFFALDKRLQSLETKIVYVGVPNRETEQRPWWDIWPSGAQGIQLAPEMVGLQHLPFTALLAEGAYVEGALPERTTVDKRPIKMAVMINVGEPDTIFRYRMLEQRWWASWSRDTDGYIGVYTRTHGWRFTRVRLEKPPPTVMTLDPQAMGNNFMQWDMEIVACDPFWQKRQETASWINEGDGAPHTPWQELLQQVLDAIRDRAHDLFPKLIPGVDVAEGNLIVPTRGTQTEWPKFLVSSPGQAWIEDGPGGVMVELPLLTENDGTVLVDTNPIARTLTATTDPIDRLFFQIARNSQLIDFILHDRLATTLPVWQRFNGRFTQPWPRRTVNRIKVRHSQLGGQVAVFMPQRYESGYGI
jgi:hypothetical protein